MTWIPPSWGIFAYTLLKYKLSFRWTLCTEGDWPCHLFKVKLEWPETVSSKRNGSLCTILLQSCIWCYSQLHGNIILLQKLQDKVPLWVLERVAAQMLHQQSTIEQEKNLLKTNLLRLRETINQSHFCGSCIWFASINKEN